MRIIAGAFTNSTSDAASEGKSHPRFLPLAVNAPARGSRCPSASPNVAGDRFASQTALAAAWPAQPHLSAAI